MHVFRIESSRAAGQEWVKKPLPDSIKDNIDCLAKFYEREEATISGGRNAIEEVGALFGKPAYFLSVFLFAALWILANTLSPAFGWPRFDEPPFLWLQGVVCLNGLLMTIAVLIRQNRLARLADQRSHLDLQVNLLTEQKTTKIIQLIDELRRDLPHLEDRRDEEVERLQTPTDPHAVLQAIEEKPSVQLGDRIYGITSWKRKDTIYLGDKKIGYIHLSGEDRTGMTVSAINGLRTKGRALAWCAEQMRRTNWQDLRSHFIHLNNGLSSHR